MERIRTRNFTCIKCDIKFVKEIFSEGVVVMCPVCGTKQKFRHKVMDTEGEYWESVDPFDDEFFLSVKRILCRYLNELQE
jgi:transcription elongation factor Elf1